MLSKFVLLLTCLNLIDAIPPSPAALHKGLPGIKKEDKAQFAKGELFRYRNEILNWYCANKPERSNLVPCKVHSQLKRTQDFLNTNAAVNEAYWDTNTNIEDSVISSDKSSAKAQYKSMFRLYCTSAKTTNLEKICENDLFYQKYIRY